MRDGTTSTTVKRGRLAIVALLGAVVACGGPGEGPGGEALADSAAAGAAASDEAYLRPTAEGGDLTAGDTIAGHPAWTEQDWAALARTARWAWDHGIDTLPIGRRMARIGETFEGTAYIPQTLEAPGPERLVINLRALDCVTFVESMMALAHFVRLADASILQRRDQALELYGALITDIRYRGGRMDGYPSRLHYFSEWIADGVEKGYLTDVAAELGGVEDATPLTFMTSHRDAYRQLADAGDFQAIQRVERRLATRPRTYLPEGRVSAAHEGIRDGDVIAMTSTLEGLDVAHTGLAVWADGVPHLLNAPLVGKSVELSEASLADRLAGIRAQDGMMVARPRETDAIRRRISVPR